MTQRTPLYDAHKAAGAKLVDFAGWDMPLHYGSQMDEHHAVRQGAGVFDVSHMCAVDISGSGSQDWLRYLLANDVAKIPVGKAIYSAMCNARGGVVDDLIVYCVAEQRYRIVVNAGTADKDIAWMGEHVGDFDVQISARRDLGIIAVQGPMARELATPLLPSGVVEAAQALPVFGCATEGDVLVGRTGYTGEDGYELIVPAVDLPTLWDELLAAGVKPCGLGARDTLRLEAGMNLYGQDMDEDTSPLAAGLGWTIAWDPAGRDFVGRETLAAQREAAEQPRFVGLVLEGRGVMRGHQRVVTSDGDGEITSGGFSPTMNGSIALARIPRGGAEIVEVEIRNKRIPARIVRPPFVRKGKVLV